MVKVVIVGAGRMGVRVGVFLALEHQVVVLCDVNEPDMAVIRMLLDKEVSDGYYSIAHVRATEERISFRREVSEACEDADVVLEMVPERATVKAQVLADISLHSPPSCLIATNTLTFSISDLSKHVSGPHRFIGIRFLFPVLNIPDVEITLGSDTDVHTSDQAKTWLVGMDLSPFYKAPGQGQNLVLSADDITQRQYAFYQMKVARRRPSLQLSAAQIYYTDGGVHPPKPTASASEGSDCVVCLQQPKTSLLYPCGHMSFCQACAMELMKTKMVCPCCRHGIQDVVKVYN